MKKVLIAVGAIFALFSTHGYSQSNTVDIFITAGELMNFNGTSPIPNGSLIQLIADTSSNAGAPTATSFTGTDPNEVVIATGTMDSTNSGFGSGNGTTDFDISNFAIGSNGTPTGAGSFLYLRWYPTLLPNASSPGSGTDYGQYTADYNEFQNDGAGTAWVMPAAGDSVDLYFVTQSQVANAESLNSGPATNPPPNSDGYASLVVAAVPEPGSISLLAGAFGLGAMALRRRK